MLTSNLLAHGVLYYHCGTVVCSTEYVSVYGTEYGMYGHLRSMHVCHPYWNIIASLFGVHLLKTDTDGVYTDRHRQDIDRHRHLRSIHRHRHRHLTEHANKHSWQMCEAETWSRELSYGEALIRLWETMIIYTIVIYTVIYTIIYTYLHIIIW